MKSAWCHALGLLAVLSSPALAQVQAGCTDDAMLVFDASGSMAISGDRTKPLPRIVEARAALRDILPRITPFRQMGLIIYGPGQREKCKNIMLHFRPSPDAAPKISSIVDDLAPEGSTPLTDAVRQAVSALQNTRGDVVLVTDGHETCGGSPCALAAELAHTDITVHVIGFRVRDAAFEWQSERGFDIRNHQTTARCLADKTGGDYVPAETADDLAEALRQVLACPSVG